MAFLVLQLNAKQVDFFHKEEENQCHSIKIQQKMGPYIIFSMF
jgi:hypothetical protein